MLLLEGWWNNCLFWRVWQTIEDVGSAIWTSTSNCCNAWFPIKYVTWIPQMNMLATGVSGNIWCSLAWSARLLGACLIMFPFFFETALIFNTRESLLPTRCVAAFSHQQGFMVCDWLCFHSCEAAFTHTRTHTEGVFSNNSIGCSFFTCWISFFTYFTHTTKTEEISVLHHGHDLYVRWVVKFSICIFFLKMLFLQCGASEKHPQNWCSNRTCGDLPNS